MLVIYQESLHDAQSTKYKILVILGLLNCDPLLYVYTVVTEGHFRVKVILSMHSVNL